MKRYCELGISNRLPRYFVNAHHDRSTIVEEGEKFLDRHAQRLA
jgi:hypothetical protein